MKNKYFITSDIHGHFNEFYNALMESGFSDINQSHFLVICGDLFDRGTQSKEIYEYLELLGDKAIVITGNHDEFLIHFLENSISQYFNANYNGFGKTIDSFIGRENDFQKWAQNRYDNGLVDTAENMFFDYQRIVSGLLNTKFPNLLTWLKAKPFFFETENYIFTHGAIDGTIPDWHRSDWRKCVWDKGDFYNSPIVNTDKTVVIGHFATRHLRFFYEGLSEERFNMDRRIDEDCILTRNDKRVIAIDACTIVSKQVNFLVIED